MNLINVLIMWRKAFKHWALYLTVTQNVIRTEGCQHSTHKAGPGFTDQAFRFGKSLQVIFDPEVY